MPPFGIIAGDDIIGIGMAKKWPWKRENDVGMAKMRLMS
jgi:hypothetical protein